MDPSFRVRRVELSEAEGSGRLRRPWMEVVVVIVVEDSAAGGGTLFFAAAAAWGWVARQSMNMNKDRMNGI